MDFLLCQYNFLVMDIQYEYHLTKSINYYPLPNLSILFMHMSEITA